MLTPEPRRNVGVGFRLRNYGILDGSALTLGTGANASLNTNYDQITLGNGASLAASGTNNTLALSNGNSVQIAGGGDVVISGQGGALSLAASSAVTIQSGSFSVNGTHPSTTTSAGTATTNAAGDLTETFSGNSNEEILGYTDGTWTDMVKVPNGYPKGNWYSYETEAISNYASNGNLVERTDIYQDSALSDGGLIRSTNTYYDPSNAYGWSVIQDSYVSIPGGAAGLQSVLVINDDGTSVSGAPINGDPNWYGFNVYHDGQIYGSDTYKTAGFAIPFSGTPINQLLGADASWDLPAYSYVLSPNSLAGAPISGNSVAQAMPGAYDFEYGPNNGSVLDQIPNGSTITVDVLGFGDGPEIDPTFTEPVSSAPVQSPTAGAGLAAHSGPGAARSEISPAMLRPERPASIAAYEAAGAWPAHNDATPSVTGHGSAVTDSGASFAAGPHVSSHSPVGGCAGGFG